MMRRNLLPAVALGLLSCTPDLEASDFRHEVSTHVEDADGTKVRFLDSIASAQRSLDVALPVFPDTDIADAIVAARDRGVELRIITDVDQRDDAGTQVLLDADIPVTLADGELSYFDFAINQDVTFASDKVRMSHSWVLVDRERATISSYAGSDTAGSRVVFELRGEDLLEDLWTEHNQVYGGSDATAVTAFDVLAKSVADFRWIYPTDTQMALQIWFGPQERLTKRMIDGIYMAKSSIWVSSDLIMNEGMIQALQYKARDGFDVRVLVGNAQPTVFNPRTPEALLTGEAPDVAKRRLDSDVVPTMLLIDYETARDGNDYPTRGYVLSHELVSAARLYQLQPVVSDQLIDGNLMVLEDWDADPHPDLMALKDLYEELYAQGVEL